MLKCLAGFLLAALLLCQPEAAANGAREAMFHWYYTVAPSLFPFMALLPLLTCEPAAHAYERLFGGFTRCVYRLPGASAAALAVGMIAGSPAGALAARRAAASSDMTRGQAQRLAMACCGMSPAFLISGVGAAMLGDPAAGHTLLRSQLVTQLFMPLLLRPFCRDNTPLPDDDLPDPTPPVTAILTVGGYMALFGALAAALGAIFDETAANVCLCAMDVTAGCRVVSNINMKIVYKMMALSALTGYGGLCVCAQNLSVLREIVHPVHFLLSRLAAAALSAALTALQTNHIIVKWEVKPLPIAALMAVFLVIPALWHWNKHSFNNSNSTEKI